MTAEIGQTVRQICAAYHNDASRLMDIVEAVQSRFGCVSSAATDLIAQALGIPRVEVQSTVSFYSFLSERPKGRVVIRLCSDPIDEMFGMLPVARSFEEALGIRVGETTPDGAISLEWTPCIGMSDQAPAALINDVVVTYLSTDKAREIVAELRRSGDPRKLVHRLGDGHNAHPLVRSMVHNNIRRKGPVVLADLPPGAALRKALAMSPVEVIRDIKTSRLRGRGGAGFPTGMKWEFTRQAEGNRKFVICNADEGEPGTFKDRVILTEYADLMFEGMAIAGYAIGAKEGILYLRGEYAYLRPLLEHILQVRRDAGLLGRDICGKRGFEFDIRIQLGAGAYVCGEETSLLSSCEGRRGDPKNRPPFPAQKGYLGCPTSVNNVETFCCVARILDRGPGWFAEIGSKGSPGTKLFSVSGDCAAPGVYEYPFGITLAELLRDVGAEDVQAVQVGGPSGHLVGPDSFHRRLEYDDLATGGSIMIFNSSRDLVHIVRKFLEFFADESCGYCTPCRVGNVLLLRKIEEILHGRGTPDDLRYLEELSTTVKFASRCGLGQTSPNPVLSLLRNFAEPIRRRVAPPAGELLPTFDIRAALADTEKLVGRTSVIYAP
ncbi:MAG: NAD(P)H-dependent oxidoreductase subunit E [Kiritimatiellae bacterium]|nr:NAD(P)H-dependent oxidoreductase subunit E [Kiritimatiellia bacterium]